MPATSAATGRVERLAYVAASTPGRVWIAVFSGAALVPSLGYLALPFALAIAVASFRTGWRRSIVSALAVAVCAVNLLPAKAGAYGLPAAALLLGGGWIAGLLVWTRLRGRHALLVLHALALAVLAAVCVAAGRTFLSGMTAAGLCALVPELLWRSSYWIKWRQRQPSRAPVWQNLFTALPFLGAGGVPFGKGPGFFAKYEASDSKTLAASQVEGVRLLALALLWRGTDAVLQLALWGIRTSWLGSWRPFVRAPLPSMEMLLRIPASFALWQRWGGLYGELLHNIIALAFYGHTIVGIFCLLGFRIPRNTRAPLAAATIVDFWARYYFYFKELLMDFFFFPAFVRTSASPVLLRTLLATWAAAFVGNSYYHAALYAPVLAGGDAHGYRSLVLARLVYCGLLATGLSLSFARALKKPQRVRQKVPRVPRAGQFLLVATFFAAIHVWNYGGAPIPLERRWHLWKTLVGMDTNIRPARAYSGR